MLPEQNKTPSPLEGVTLTRFQGKTYVQEQVITVNNTRSTLLRNNPNRLFWIAINESVNDVRLSNDPNLTATSGWLLSSNGGVISMYWEEDGEGVGYEVYAFGALPGLTVRVREVIRE